MNGCGCHCAGTCASKEKACTRSRQRHSPSRLPARRRSSARASGRTLHTAILRPGTRDVDDALDTVGSIVWLDLSRPPRALVARPQEGSRARVDLWAAREVLKERGIDIGLQLVGRREAAPTTILKPSFDSSREGRENAPVGGAGYAEAGTAQDALEAELDGLLPGEESPEPIPYLGLNNLKLDDEVDVYGNNAEILADCAAAGAGIVRQLNDSDLTWLHLFPYDDDPDAAVIPPPAELYARLTEDNYPAFMRFSVAVLFAMQEGLQVIPGLFTRGGGSRLNDDPVAAFDNRGEFVKLIQNGAPRYHAKPLIPSKAGWDSFYYSGIGEPSSTEERFFHQYGLSLLDLEEREDLQSPYAAEASRRKALGVAAFGQAVGEYFAWLDELLKSIFGVPLVDVVPGVELGNEMETCWLGDEELERGATEMARFVALLAGPVRDAWPDGEIIVGALAAYAEDRWQPKLRWLERALTEELGNDVTFWNLVQEDFACIAGGTSEYSCFHRLAEGSDEEEARYYTDRGPRWRWLQTCQAAEWCWPPANREVTLTAAEMVGRIGAHWYHTQDFHLCHHIYQDETRIKGDVEGLDAVAEAIEDIHGTRPSVDLSEIGFPSAIPDNPANLATSCGGTGGGIQYNQYASEAFQAGKLVRLLLAARASGAQRVIWHTHMSKWGPRSGQNWTLFSSMGLRNDIGTSNFSQAIDAWPRPSWYAFRRLAWFLDRSSSVSWLYAGERRESVISLTARDRFRIGRSSWRYALVAWLDQRSPVGAFRLELPQGETYALLPLLPAVTATGATVDTNGFAAGVADWWWSGWNDFRATEFSGEERGTIVRIERGEQSNPRVLCMLTNTDRIEVLTWF